jgi:hypothetical protein
VLDEFSGCNECTGASIERAMNIPGLMDGRLGVGIETVLVIEVMFTGNAVKVLSSIMLVQCVFTLKEDTAFPASKLTLASVDFEAPFILKQSLAVLAKK